MCKKWIFAILVVAIGAVGYWVGAINLGRLSLSALWSRAGRQSCPERGHRGPTAVGGGEVPGEDGSTSEDSIGARPLLLNGSFEWPGVPNGSYLTFDPGDVFGSWKVVGAGSVSPLSTTFFSRGFTFQARDGAQSVDLTGPSSNAAEGVAQTVATHPGARYDLSFWVGNVVDPTGPYGTSSTVNVLVDGTPIFQAVNADGTGTHTLNWRKFTVTFVANRTAPRTTITLLNGDPLTDTSNFIDDIVLVAHL